MVEGERGQQGTRGRGGGEGVGEEGEAGGHELERLESQRLGLEGREEGVVREEVREQGGVRLEDGVVGRVVREQLQRKEEDRGEEGRVVGGGGGGEEAAWVTADRREEGEGEFRSSRERERSTDMADVFWMRFGEVAEGGELGGGEGEGEGGGGGEGDGVGDALERDVLERDVLERWDGKWFVGEVESSCRLVEEVEDEEAAVGGEEEG